MKAPIVLAALLSGVLFAPAASAEPPALFINLLYAHYADMDHWAKNYDPCHTYCEADFAKLVAAARHKHVIDYDPICQCQHGGEKYMMFTGGTGATDNDYMATMKKLSDPRGSWVLVLRWVEGEWKIRDIVELRGGKQVSLRQRLTAAGA
ncbi:MAG: hypothetical protein KGJ78_09340 [Alphaproteobacteria bacterium]|nr:hypothetical protein [Alphaproteobacteria bacterium]